MEEFSLQSKELSSDGPLFTDAAKSRTSLTIVRPGDLVTCSFWLAFYRPGSKLAGESCKGLSLEQRLIYGGIKGFNESLPVVLADVEGERSHHHMFIPAGYCDNPCGDVASVVNMIAGWNPVEIGLYVAPEIFKKATCHILLSNLLRKIIKDHIVTDIYLFTGSHGLNELVAVASDIRMEMPMPIDIFH